jgi:hypothetical protein
MQEGVRHLILEDGMQDVGRTPERAVIVHVGASTWMITMHSTLWRIRLSSIKILASVVATSADLRRLFVFVVTISTTDNLNLGLFVSE